MGVFLGCLGWCEVLNMNRECELISDHIYYFFQFPLYGLLLLSLSFIKAYFIRMIIK